MTQFLLTSYERMRRHLAAETGDPMVDGVNLRRELLGWIPTVSAMIEGYCNRSFSLESRTEYFDVSRNQTEFFVSASPIATLTSVYYDVIGLFQGGEGEITDCYIGTNAKSVIIPYSETESRRSLRIIYTGGFGASATRSILNCTITGTFTSGKFAVGGTSNACGIIRAVAATSLTIEVLYGIFEVGETIAEWATEDAVGASTATAIVTSAASRAIAEEYPDIVKATEMQIRYMYKNKLRFEDSSVQKDGQSTRSYPSKSMLLALQPEAIQLLDGYVTAAFV